MKKVSYSSRGCCPAHYVIPGSDLEVVDLIYAYSRVFNDAWEFFCFASILQYVTRAQFKGEKSKDLGKAMTYLDWWKKTVDERKHD